LDENSCVDLLCIGYNGGAEDSLWDPDPWPWGWGGTHSLSSLPGPLQIPGKDRRRYLTGADQHSHRISRISCV